MRSITVDVEDYRSLIIRDTLGLNIPVSGFVDHEIDRLLELLDDLDIKVTCFIVGRLAKERPHIPRAIAARDHEIASHSFEHLRMHQHSPRTFAKDLRASIDTLEDITGSRVRGFRAPAFSLGLRQRWAFAIMAEKGIQYDSSVRLVWPFGREQGKVLLDEASKCGIKEFPGFALGCGSFRVPLGGGGGMRLVPEWLTRWGLGRAQRAGYTVPLYVHPYDFTLQGPKDWPPAQWNRRVHLAWLNWMQHRGRSRMQGRLRNAIDLQIKAEAGRTDERTTEY